MDDALRISALLIRHGVLPQSQARELPNPAVRTAVDERLKTVGLEVVETALSDHYGVRLTDDVLAHAEFEAATNLGLKSDELALLAILWMRLVLQRRLDAERAEITPKAARAAAFTIREQTLVSDYRPILGSASHVQRNLGRLARLHFVRRRAGLIEAGPLLTLAIDANKMTEFVQSELLPKIDLDRPAEAVEPSLRERVLKAVEDASTEIGMAELEKGLNVPKTRIRPELQRLMQEGVVGSRGKPFAMRYYRKVD